MKVKIEFELENGDLVTLIKTFALIFNKIDINKVVDNNSKSPTVEIIGGDDNLVGSTATADIDVYGYMGEPSNNTMPQKIDEKKKD